MLLLLPDKYKSSSVFYEIKGNINETRGKHFMHIESIGRDRRDCVYISVGNCNQ